MREHILSRGSEFIPYISSQKTYYDFQSQINYLEKNYENKLIHSQEINGPTIKTESLEASDHDNIVMQCFLKGPTATTYTIEESDKDN